VQGGGSFPRAVWIARTIVELGAAVNRVRSNHVNASKCDPADPHVASITPLGATFCGANCVRRSIWTIS
jgi:hypothetical protein